MTSDEALTGEQRAAVERREGPLLLAAGAGSGKTRVLVERFVRAVREDGVPVDAILAITFTEKAAAELEERVRRSFRAGGDDAAARAVERGWIGTIHGFCARLLRDHALDAGLDPRFSVLDAPGAERLAREAFAAALEDLAAARGDDAIDLLASYRPDRLRDLVLAAHGELRSRGAAAPALPPLAELPDPAPLRTALGEVRSAAAREIASAEGNGPTVTRALETLERGETLLDGLGERTAAPAQLADLCLPKGSARALAGDACTAYREAWEAYRSACTDHHASRAYLLVDALLRSFAARYAAARQAAGALDFADLELGAHALLVRRPELRASYAARFSHVMVDELQDTNPLQLELLDLVAPGGFFGVGDAFQSVYGFRHADVRLFEDLRARLAEHDRALTLATSFRSRPAILEVLNLAFGPVFGSSFTPLVPGRTDAETDGDSPRVELLLADAGADWSDVALTRGDAPLGTPRWRLAEARGLGRRVAELVAAGRPPGEIVVLLRASTDLAVFERALEDEEIPTYVVGGRGYWARREVQDLVALLCVLANPYDGTRLFEVLASPLVGVSSDALVYLAATTRAAGGEPWDTLRRTFAPAGRAGATAPATPAARAAGHAPATGEGADLAGALADADRAKLERAVPWLLAQRAAAPLRGLEAVLDEAMRATGFDLAILGLRGGRRRLANVRKLMRLAREYEAEAGSDLRGFLDRVAERSSEQLADARESEAPVEGEALDAVRLMTIHRAKGLEFPVVCLADLGRQPPSGGRDLLRLSRDGSTAGLKLATLDGGLWPALGYEDVGRERQREEAEEERRLFYVGMTRAREHLVVSGALDPRRDPARRPPPIEWIAPALVPDVRERMERGEETAPVHRPEGGRALVGLRIHRPEGLAAVAKGAPEPGGEPPTGSSPQPTAEAIVGEALGARTAPVAPATAPGAPGAPLALSYSALGELDRCGYRFYLERVLGLPPRPEPGRPPAGAAPGLAANVRGIVVHALLERLDFARPAAPGVAEIDAAARAAGARPTPEEVAEIARLVAAFGRSPLCARLAAARRVRREERFGLLLDAARGAPLLEGVLDVVAWEGDRALVVDFKTDRLGPEDDVAAVVADYAAQRAVYALAALRAGAAEVEVAHAFLERPEAVASARYAAHDAAALAAEVSGRAAPALAGEYRVAAAPHDELCHGCPGRGTLCSWPEAATRGPAVGSAEWMPTLFALPSPSCGG